MTSGGYKERLASDDPELAPLLWQKAIYTVELRKDVSFTLLVTIVDARRLWDRVDVLVETNTGSRVWASTKHVKPVSLSSD